MKVDQVVHAPSVVDTQLGQLVVKQLTARLAPLLTISLFASIPALSGSTITGGSSSLITHRALPSAKSLADSSLTMIRLKEFSSGKNLAQHLRVEVY